MMRAPQTHVLKTWPQQMAGVVAGAKCHEVRRFDRDFVIGDTVLLREYILAENRYTGAEAEFVISWITHPGTFGLPFDVGVLSLRTAHLTRLLATERSTCNPSTKPIPTRSTVLRASAHRKD